MKKWPHNKKECCCLCANQFPAEVCNCFDEWPKDLLLGISEINEKHGTIGWVCGAFAFEGTMNIMRSNHGLCECFNKRKKK